MASNQFLTSPFSDPNIVVEETAAPTAPVRPAARGLAPSQADIIKRAQQLDIDPKLALSLFSQESSGNWSSKDSPKGAKGGMQVLPGTYRQMMGTDAGQSDPWNNMEAGLRYIRYGQDKLKTRDPAMLAAGYHAGYDHPDLKAGRIPNTNDGLISTSDYARNMVARVNGEAPARRTRFPNRQPKPSVLDELNKGNPGLYEIDTSGDAGDPVLDKLNAGNPGLYEIDKGDSPIPDPQEKAYLDRLISETKAGFGDMTNSLMTARWAVGGEGDEDAAARIAKSLQAQSAQVKNADQQYIDSKYQAVTDAKGAAATTVAGAKALWASVTHPKETSLEVARNAANALPSIVGGAAGAAGGAAVGSAVPVAGTAVGAIVGGRTGMAVGATATELGAEIQDMVQKRLADQNLAPTAQNVLAVISDKGFKDEARAQGLKKGLTVAAVDQVFMGIGGKIATAPVRKAATRELAEQGVDVSTRAARNAALSSPAGQAAMEAAKPSMGSKVASHAAAVAVDAAGESIGEGASQQVARGHVDYGDALREGVASLGQAAIETGIGSTIETAKIAAKAGRAQIVPTANAPSTASGPLARATENAAAKPERVTVTAPDGQVSGTVTGQTADGSAVQIVGDDGHVYNFATGANGIKITPEDAPTPLTNTVEQAAEQHAEEPAPAPVVPEAAPPAPAPEAPAPEAAPVAETPVQPAKPAKAPDYSAMGEDELRARLKYIAEQGKVNGWNKMLVEQRRAVEKAINAKAPKVEAPAVEQPSLDLTSTKPTEEAAPVVQATPSQKAAATLPKELAGAKPRSAYGQKQFDLSFASDIDRAAYIAAQKNPSKRDADYVKFVSDATGMTEAEVRAHGAQVREAIKAMGKDAEPGTLNVPEQARGQTTIEKTPAPATEQAPVVNQSVTTEPATPPAEAPAKPTTASKEDLEHLFGIDKKRQKALERIAKGTAFFHDGVKAKDFIAKNGLKDTHEVKKGKAGRWDIVAKSTQQEATSVEATTAPTVTAQAEAARDQAPEAVGGNGSTEAGVPASGPASVEAAGVVRSKHGYAEVKLRGAKHFVTPYDDQFVIREKSGLIARDEQNKPLQFKTEEEAIAYASNNAKRSTDGNDNRTSGKPASAEEVGKEAGAGQAEAAPVQPAAAKEVGDEPSHKQRGDVADVGDKVKVSSSRIVKVERIERDADGIISAVYVRTSDVFTAEGEWVAQAGKGTQKLTAGEFIRYSGGVSLPDAPAKAATTSATVAPPDGWRGNLVKTRLYARKLIEAGILDADEAHFAWSEPDNLTKLIDEYVSGPSNEPTDPTGKSAAKSDPFANNKLFTSDKVAAARERLKKKLSGTQLNSGIDPELLMDGIIIAGGHIESGTRAFAAYAKAMIEDLGDGVKPYLLSFYEAARNYPGLDTEGMSSVDDAKAEFDKLIKPADIEQAKEAIGEIVQKPAKRTRKTGSKADMTLTQDWGVDHIDGYGDGTREIGNDMKDAFLKEASNYLKAVADVLTQRGFMEHQRNGKPMKAVSVNESGMEGAGYVSLALRFPEIGSGIYVHIGDTALRGIAPTTPSGIAVMFRATTEQDPYGGKENRWAPTDLSASDFADMLEKEARRYAKEPNNGPQKLDQSGPRELEGKQPDTVQGAEPQRQAGDGAEGSSGADARGDVGAGSSGVQQSGSVGNDAGEVPSLAARVRAGRGGKQGGSTVQRGKRASKPNPADAERGNQPELIPTSGTRAQDRADDFTITDEDAIGEGGAKTKFKQNVAAIRLLKQLTAENRQATRAEQAVLAKYVGWGGIPQAFYRDNDEVTKGWEKEAAELKDVLTPEELAAAAASTRNAHYTSTEIVEGMWDAVKHFGFQGGRVQEPSVGVGNFFGMMPAALRSASQLTGVELDHITGGIAKQLYPQANIQAPVGFQDFSAPDNYFDLAIGNPPFGAEKIYDGNRRKISGFSIHNYFFAKSIDTVRPNGVLAMVVTNRLLDSVGDKARQYIADRAEFLGAIRLPNDAFMKNAGTAVTTDIIFLRKLKEGEQPTGHKWMDVKQVTDANGKTVPLNEYFVKNPDMMLGEFGAYGSMYRPDDAALIARPGQDTKALMKEAIAKLPSGFMDPPTAAPVFETIEPMHDVSHVKIGSVFEQDGQIYERREDMLGKQQAVPVTFPNEKAKERVTGMIKVRDALVEVRRLQLQENVPEANLEAARADLNKTYDAFVKAHGPLNADANKRLMRDDPTWPQIAALEDSFDKGISAAVAKSTGEKARAPSATKSAIFFKRTQSPYRAPTKADTAKDALVASLSERGRVDLDYMASLYGKSPEEITKELDGLIYESAPGDWVTRDEYLSGNVKKRLALTIELAKKFPRFQKNVDALRAVQPADIEAVDIDVKTGAHWVPADVMQSFIAHITGGQNPRAVYNPVTASWSLDADRIAASASTQWATDRANVIAILEAAANQKQMVIYDKHADGSRTLNEKATTAANEKVERVKAEWKNWIWSDDDRRTRLHRIYNDTFNTDVQRQFDGSHLTFPGKVGDDIIRLRPHQSNAVWRMVQSGTTLLDHVVGAGKTFTMIAGIMEMRRMGLAKKPMLVVPNHLVGQWAVDFLKLYPGANILAATKKDFEKENRKRLFARIATGDWDAVIVAHSSFGKVEVEPEFQEQFIRQQIDDMDLSIAAMRAAEGKGSRNVKQIEKQKANLEEKLKRLFDTGAKDDNLYFSELGVDAVLLDEAHEFKNLGFSTGMQRVAGLGNPTGSNKAADMFMKVQSVLKRTGGKNVVFATGTPISNTMAEMYTMQRYLDYDTLKDQGISHFDAWAKTFGEVVTDWELSPSGQYKMNSRFAKFVNMPELMQRYQSFGDVVNRDDINRMLAAQGKKLPVPKVKGGKPENIVVDRSGTQAAYIGVPVVSEDGQEEYPKGSLVWRAENLPKKAEKGADNMLKIMSDARKAALDMRLIDPGAPDNPESKVNVAAKRIRSIYDKWDAKKGTQLVFIDLSTPKGAVAKEAAALRELVAKAEEGDEAAQEKLDAMSPDELLALDSSFSVYDDLKQKLINLGITENEIAFIHDANTELQKEELFGKVRSGRIRVLFGSTAKMGAGMNVQDRLVALHHLDAPWRPSDLEQREGRIIRQGNKLYDEDPEGFEVEILRYATKQTLDSRMWQTIEAKARFIEQVRKGSGEREVEDVAGEAANSAEMKAASSGNPIILEEMTLRQAIRKLENQKSEHEREQHRIKDRIRWMGDQAKSDDAKAAALDVDAPLAPKEFSVTVGNQTFDKHGEAGEAILAAVDAMHAANEDSRDIGTYGGFKLSVEDTSRDLAERTAVLTIKGKSDDYQVDANPGSSPQGLSLRMQNTVRGLAEEAKRLRDRAESSRADVPKLEAQIKPWGHDQELADAKARHMAVIEQLKPKQKPKAQEETPDAPAFSRNPALEGIFESLDGRGLARKRALDALADHPDGETIRYIDQNFLDLLEELSDKKLVDIKC